LVDDAGAGDAQATIRRLIFAAVTAPSTAICVASSPRPGGMASYIPVAILAWLDSSVVLHHLPPRFMPHHCVSLLYLRRQHERHYAHPLLYIQRRAAGRLALLHVLFSAYFFLNGRASAHSSPAGSCFMRIVYHQDCCQRQRWRQRTPRCFQNNAPHHVWAYGMSATKWADGQAGGLGGRDGTAG